MASISSVVGGLNIGSDRELRSMKTGKANGWGMEYRWIELGESDNVQSKDSPYDWCVERYGKPGIRWFEKKRKFYFKNEQDLTMFILKFS